MNGTIDHRPDRPSPWRARYRDPDGRLRSKSFRRQSDAQAWLREKLGSMDHGKWVDPADGQLTWDEWSGQLQASRLHLAARTRETDEICHHRATPQIGQIPLARLTPDNIRSLMAALLADGYAPETVAKTMRWVRLTLNQAVRDRRIGISPADGIRLPKPRRGTMRLLEADEVQLLAHAVPSRYQSLVIVAAFTGMRFGEMAGLRVSDIDMLRRRLTVSNALVEAAGEPPRLGPPKSAASERTITLPRIAVHALAEHLIAHPPVNDIVWTTERGAFLRRGSFGRIWRQAVDASVGAPCRVHDLRHTHVAWLIAAGEHPRAIMTRLGHASITTTINTYGWLMDGLDERTADRLDSLARTGGEAGVAQRVPNAPLTVSSSNAETPAEAGVSRLQPRPGSNWRYRLERPAS